MKKFRRHRLAVMGALLSRANAVVVRKPSADQRAERSMNIDGL